MNNFILPSKRDTTDWALARENYQKRRIKTIANGHVKVGVQKLIFIQDMHEMFS